MLATASAEEGNLVRKRELRDTQLLGSREFTLGPVIVTEDVQMGRCLHHILIIVAANEGAAYFRPAPALERPKRAESSRESV